MTTTRLLHGLNAAFATVAVFYVLALALKQSDPVLAACATTCAYAAFRFGALAVHKEKSDV